jgi:ATP-dependent Clp protease ATP-binding subunit ClpA
MAGQGSGDARRRGSPGWRGGEGQLFERFTDRARRVVVLAQEEARLLKHNYIGTEHLLLGLLTQSPSVATTALESLGISLEAVRSQVEERIGHGAEEPSGHLPFTPRAKKVLELSLREMLQLGHNYIGTEHLLLGLLREGEGVAAQVLVTLGADRDRVGQQIMELLRGDAGGVQEDPQTRLVRVTVPADIRELEEQLAQVRRDKEAAIDADDFDRAAVLRDQERQLWRRLVERERAWTAGVDRAAIIHENHNLHREVERLRELLGRYGIDPDDGTEETA